MLDDLVHKAESKPTIEDVVEKIANFLSVVGRVNSESPMATDSGIDSPGNLLSDIECQVPSGKYDGAANSIFRSAKECENELGTLLDPVSPRVDHRLSMMAGGIPIQ